MAAAALMFAVPAVAGLAGSIAGNISNSSIASNNNAFNARMLAMQMDYNKQMYERQLGDTWAFYNDQKEYNSPVAQRQRLEDAGLNPALYMGAGNTGQVQSYSAPSAAGVNPPQASPYSANYSGIAEGIGAGIDAYLAYKRSNSQNALADAQAYNTQIEGKYIAAKALGELALMKSQAKSLDVKRDIDNIVKAFMPDMQAADLRLKGQQAQQNEMNLKLSGVEYVMQSQRLSFLPLQLKLQLGLDAANLAKIKSEKNLTDKQVEHEAQKIAETIARSEKTRSETSSINIQNSISRTTYSEQVNLIRAELVKAVSNIGPDGAQGIFNLIDAGFNKDYYKSLMPKGYK